MSLRIIHKDSTRSKDPSEITLTSQRLKVFPDFPKNIEVLSSSFLFKQYWLDLTCILLPLYTGCRRIKKKNLCIRKLRPTPPPRCRSLCRCQEWRKPSVDFEFEPVFIGPNSKWPTRLRGDEISRDFDLISRDLDLFWGYSRNKP